MPSRPLRVGHGRKEHDHHEKFGQLNGAAQRSGKEIAQRHVQRGDGDHHQEKEHARAAEPLAQRLHPAQPGDTGTHDRDGIRIRRGAGRCGTGFYGRTHGYSVRAVRVGTAERGKGLSTGRRPGARRGERYATGKPDRRRANRPTASCSPPPVRGISPESPRRAAPCPWKTPPIPHRWVPPAHQLWRNPPR